MMIGLFASEDDLRESEALLEQMKPDPAPIISSISRAMPGMQNSAFTRSCHSAHRMRGFELEYS
jgi:hypothetical protein